MTAYDEVPYPSYTHPQTHPDRLATIARLFGLSPAPVARCRVLEIGCGDGSNLLPMACELPGSEFVGIDLATHPIEQGKEAIRALALGNIRLVTGDLATIDASWGRFDYVIVHGLFSWIPEAVRDQLLAVCRAALSDHGVAFVSYNAKPGSHLRAMLREMMHFHTARCTVPEQRIQQARALAAFLAGATTSGHIGQEALRSEARRVLEYSPASLFHDDLSDVQQPFLFADFVAQAARHRLQYLAEADFPEMSEDALTDEGRQALAQLAGQRIAREQYLDFAKCRRFRQTLLCLEERIVPGQADARVVGEMFVASTGAVVEGTVVDLRPGVKMEFRAFRGTTFGTDSPVAKAAMLTLFEAHGYPLAFEGVLDSAFARLGADGIEAPSRAAALEQLCPFFLRLYGASAVLLFSTPPRHARDAGPQPKAIRLARSQVAAGDTVVNAFHTKVQVQDELGRYLLQMLDGTHDHAALTELVWEFLRSRGALVDPAAGADLHAKVAADLERNLISLARLGLLEA